MGWENYTKRCHAVIGGCQAGAHMGAALEQSARRCRLGTYHVSSAIVGIVAFLAESSLSTAGGVGTHNMLIGFGVLNRNHGMENTE